MAEEKKGGRKPDEARKPAQGDGGGKNEKPHKGAADKPRRDEKTRQPTRSRGNGPRRDEVIVVEAVEVVKNRHNRDGRMRPVGRSS